MNVGALTTDRFPIGAAPRNGASEFGSKGRVVIDQVYRNGAGKARRPELMHDPSQRSNDHG